MKKENQYIGKVYCGWWEVISYDTTNYTYTLKNKANGQVLDNVRKETMTNIAKGKTTISKLISIKLAKNGITSNQSWWLV